MLNTLSIPYRQSPHSLQHNYDCLGCGPFKATHQPLDHRIHIPRSTKPLAIFFADTSGPLRVRQSADLLNQPDTPSDIKKDPNFDYASFTGTHAFLLLVDDATRYTYYFPLTSKKSTSQVLDTFFTHIATRFPHNRTHTIISDQGTEFTNQKVRDVFTAHGIEFHPGPSGNPTFNSVVERMMRSAKSGGLSLLAQCGLPLSFLSLAIEHFINIFNLQTRVRDSKPYIPFQALYNNQDLPASDDDHSSSDSESDSTPSTAATDSSQITDRLRNMLLSLHIFGQSGWVVKNTPPVTKVFEHAAPAIYLGYRVDTKRCCVLLPLKGVITDCHLRQFIPFSQDRFCFCRLFAQACRTSMDGVLDSPARLRALIDPFMMLYDHLRVHRMRIATDDAISSFDDNSSLSLSPTEFRPVARADNPPSGRSEGPPTTNREVVRGRKRSNDGSPPQTENSSQPNTDNYCTDLVISPAKRQAYICLIKPDLSEYVDHSPDGNTDHDARTHPLIHVALKSPEAPLWMDACCDELASLNSFNVYELADLPSGRTAISTRWVPHQQVR